MPKSSFYLTVLSSVLELGAVLLWPLILMRVVPNPELMGDMFRGRLPKNTFDCGVFSSSVPDFKLLSKIFKLALAEFRGLGRSLKDDWIELIDYWLRSRGCGTFLVLALVVKFGKLLLWLRRVSRATADLVIAKLI